MFLYRTIEKASKLTKKNWKFCLENPYYLRFVLIEGASGRSFNFYKKNSELSGIKLADLIISGKFRKSKINLIGFSLGCNLIYHCLKHLYDQGKSKLISNVILFGGASSIGNDWNSCRSVVMKRFINVRSNGDLILNWPYKFSECEEPIGLKKIQVNNIEDFILTENIGHTNYRDKMKDIFKLIRYEGS